MELEIDVLVVDDDRSLVSLILLLLSDLGLRAETAGNGRDGLEKARTLHPRLILSDLMMPVMRGDDMVNALRGHPTTADIPCILMTSAPGMVQAQVNALIPKPFDLDRLEQLVTSHLNGH